MIEILRHTYHTAIAVQKWTAKGKSKMRDRLIELLKEAHESWLRYVDECAFNQTALSFSFEQMFADHLLAKGVIVPPDKPLPLIDEGDRVLCPICETDLMGCYMGYDESPTVVTCYACGSWIDNTKAVTREEAERALERREEK